MQKNKLLTSMAIVGMAASLTVSGCANKEQKEEVEITTTKDDRNLDEILEEVVENIEEEIENSKEEVINNQIFKIDDLYVFNRPVEYGEVYQYICNKKGETEEDGEKYMAYDVLTSYSGIRREILLPETGIPSSYDEWWIPDYKVVTLTPLSTYLEKLHYNINDDKTLTYKEIDDLFYKMNNIFPSYEDYHNYSIDSLIMINCDGKYSLYSSDRKLIYESLDGCPIYYLFDITDYRNGLRIDINTKTEDFDGTIIFGENVKDYKITSLKVEYADSLEDKEKELIFGSPVEAKIPGYDRVLVYKLYSYLSEEQIEKKSINQREAERLIKSLNSDKKLSLKNN